MIVRVTPAEVDTVRTSLRRAVELFEGSVLPELREQDGYQGCFVLTTPEGKALVLTFWTDEESADAAVASGAYGAHVDKFVAILRAPSGRDHYDVAVVDAPAFVA
jgi:heme-degrading monooxygenase HmoA